jgi:very-short-patch-repair endonuclease
MLKLDKKFLEILKKKLSFGSTRSILINCIPGKLASRLSVSDLDIIKQGLSTEFIDKLTSQLNFEIKFSIKYDTVKKSLLSDVDDPTQIKNGKKIKFEKRITSIKYDHEDYLKEHGVETFGFGFPILVRRNPNDTTKVIASPLFIWPLDIKQTFNAAKEWVIVRNSETGIKINEALRSYLKSENHIDLPIIPDEMLEDGLMEKKEIEDFIKSLEHKLNIKNINQFNWENLDNIPDKIEVSDEGIGESRILLNGVFGIYKSQKQSLINDLESLIKLAEVEENEQTDILIWEHKNSTIEVDPSQNSVLRSLSSNDKVVIQGPPGTGKSQTLTAIITTALSNKKKVLVVCEKRTALEVIYSNIVKKYPLLSQSIAIIEDVTTDRNLIVKNVRDREANNQSEQIRQIDNNIKSDIEYFEKIISEVDQDYKNLRELIHEDKRWIDLVAKWMALKVSKVDLPKIDKLSRSINIDFNIISNAEVIGIIKNTENCFIKGEFLCSKYDKLFISEYHHDSTSETLAKLKALKYELELEYNKVNRLLNEYVVCVDKDSNKLIEEKLAEVIKLNVINNNLLIKFKDPYRPTVIEKFKLLFNAKKNDIKNNLEELNAIYQSINDFVSQNINIHGEKNVNFDFDNLINTNRNKIFNNLRTDKLEITTLDYSLSSKDLKNSLELSLASINLIIIEIEQIISINNFKIDAFSYSTIKATLSNNYKLFNDILTNEQELTNYLDWKIQKRDLSESLSKLIDLFIELGSFNWCNEYESALIYQILSKSHKTTSYPKDASQLDLIKNLMLQIVTKQEQVIKNNISEWYEDGIDLILDEDFTLKKLYNLKGSPGSTRNSLRKIINFDPISFTDLHPLILANPTTCSTLFPLQAGFFDLVIFDEASQLRIEETFSSAYRGKVIVVSGDSQQMPPSSYFETSKNLVDDSESELLDDDNAQYQETSSIEMATKESLLDWAIDEGFHETYLDMHYRSKHPDLIEFSNTCFYGSRLIPMPETITEIPIEFNQLDGIFEKGTNETEGLEVLNILKNKINIGKSVGVATFNLVQRNLILNLIAKERYENSDFNLKMTSLIANGFFVKNLENIQGDERDIIIISTTFGKKKDGKFIMNFGPINQKNGHRLLNVIITRAKEKVFLITSIPENRQFEFKNFIELENRVSGKSGLLAYLQYCKHVSLNNHTEKEDLLKYIRSKINVNQNSLNSKIGLTESPFEEEVYQYLVPEFGKDNIMPQYKCGGFRIDLVVISPLTQKKIAIECDGAAYHSSELTWHHDIYRQKQLESQGFIFHRIWSTDWFKNTESELVKLYDFIKSN